jgi:tryptophanyl-tRNA synthetase
LQNAFKVRVVIQLSDDASFLRNNNLTIAECKRLARENAKDIIACGFDIQRTFIFTNIYTRGAFYENILEVAKRVTCEDSIEIIGGSQEDNIGVVGFPPVEAAPSLPCHFPISFLAMTNRGALYRVQYTGILLLG